MKKKYISPELEIVKLSLSADVLTPSQGEQGSSSGGYVPPDEDGEFELLG